MKLTIQQDISIGENEIIIRCAHMDAGLQRLIDCIRQFSFSLEGVKEGRIYQVPLEKILYIETVDRNTFMYDEETAYESRMTLTALEEMLKNTAFVRINKSCILNIGFLKCVEPYPNHRLKAILKNGENLIIARNYIGVVREKLSAGRIQLGNPVNKERKEYESY